MSWSSSSLADGSRVEYGFKRDGDWVFSLRYEIRTDGTVNDGGAGRVPANAHVDGADFYSYLTYSDDYYAAPKVDRDSVKGALSINRTGAPQPGYVDGHWETGKSYASGGVGAERKVWRPS